MDKQTQPMTMTVYGFKVTYTEGRQQPFTIWTGGRVAYFCKDYDEVVEKARNMR